MAFAYFSQNLETRRVRAGAGIRGVGGEVRTVSRIVHHPSFGVLDQDGDIAMIVLSYALPLGTTIQQAPIMGQGIQLPEGMSMTLVGWGTTAVSNLVFCYLLRNCSEQSTQITEWDTYNWKERNILKTIYWSDAKCLSIKTV